MATSTVMGRWALVGNAAIAALFLMTACRGSSPPLGVTSDAQTSLVLAHDLIRPADKPFRVEFEVHGVGEPMTQLIWRQSNGSKRWDVETKSTTSHGSFQVETGIRSNGVPTELAACSWTELSDAGTVSLTCGGFFDGADTTIAIDSTATFGRLRHDLPDREIANLEASCYTIAHSEINPGGEVCVSREGSIPVYFDFDTGAEFVATRATTDAAQSSFSIGLVARFDTRPPPNVSRTDAEIP